MSSLKQKLKQKKRKRPPKPTTTDEDDDDDALIAKLEKKLGGRKKAKDDDPLADLIGDDSSDDAESIEQEETTAAHYAPQEGQDIYGRPTDKKWVPPSLRRRLNNDNTPTAVGDVLRGALNKVSDTNIDATSDAICGAYAKFPANDVHAFVSSHMRETCVHGAQNMEALVPPYAAVIAAADTKGGRELGAHVLEALLPDLESEGKRRGNAAALLAAFCDVGLCGGELTMSYAEALRDDGTADALEACAIVATGSRDVWRRSDLRGRLSKLALKDESGDDARLLQAKNALRNACASKPGDVSRSKSLRAAVARAVPNGRARDAPLALSWSDLRNAEATGRWWRRGAAYDRHAQDALADDVAQRRAAAKAPSSKQEQTMRALRLNTPAKRAAFGGVAGAADAHDAATALHALSTKRLCDDRTAAGVLQTCCGGEPTYNPFYAEVAKLRRGESKDFAFGLKLACWDAFKASDASEDARKAARRAANLGKFCAALLGPELPLSVAFSKVEARSLVADAAVKVAVLSALRGLLVEASDEAFAGALSMEPSPGAVTVAPFAQTRLKRPAGADASAWAAREAELVAWFEGGGGE